MADNGMTSEDSRIFRAFQTAMIVLFAGSIAALFFGMALRTQHLLHQEMLTRARAHVDGIITTRAWAAGYQGVYVKKSPEDRPNPFLDEPVLVGRDGEQYLRKNPATMTREISDLSQRQGLFTFRITSSRPVNPANAPDAFEREGLDRFEAGTGEYQSVEQRGAETLFRYMAPLYVDASCLDCHRYQHYAPGDLHGAVSVSFSIADVRKNMIREGIVIFVLALAALGILIAVFFFFLKKMRRRLHRLNAQLERMATTDALTGIANRGHLMDCVDREFSRSRRHNQNLSFVLFDIDRFKDFNDTFGHQAGDTILRMLATLTVGMLRTYDIFGRYGGEEFLLVLPDTSEEDAFLLAERVRTTIEAELAGLAGVTQGSIITVSGGVGRLREDDADAAAAIRRADVALYAAKRNGRNRIERDK